LENRHIAVVGNGIIGHGVAEVFAKAGWSVSLIGRSRPSLERALERIRASMEVFVQAGLLAPDAVRLRCSVSASARICRWRPGATWWSRRCRRTWR
jgi:3-hydroxyacyl-CoA dehydrogenase